MEKPCLIIPDSFPALNFYINFRENSHENNMRVGNGNAHLIRWYDHAANRGHRTGGIHIKGVKFLPKKKRKE